MDSEELETLKVKLVTVLHERTKGRGNYDRLTEIANELRAAIARATGESQ